MRRSIAVAGLVAVVLLVVSPRLSSQSQSASLSVSANVIRNCTIATAPINFGAYDPVAANATQPLDGVGTITVTCTRGTSAHIGLSLGVNGAGGSRRMSQGGVPPYLTYEIYKDASRSTVWGSGFSNNLDIPSAPSIAPRTYSAYGRVPSAQDVTVGSYVDTVLATVDF